MRRSNPLCHKRPTIDQCIKALERWDKYFIHKASMTQSDMDHWDQIGNSERCKDIIEYLEEFKEKA